MSESNGTRRYFNLAGVVRDLEHARGEYSTAEGRDLLDRFRDIVIEATEVAAALDADDDPEDEGDTDDSGGDEVGDESELRGPADVAGPRRDAQSRDALLARIAGLERELAALTGPQSRVPRGAGAVDDTGASAPRTVSNGTRTKKRSSKKHASKKR